MVKQPVGDRRAADEGELLLGLAEQDAVADHAALRRDRDELLGGVHRELRGGVDAGVSDQLQRVRTGDKDVVHVVRLVVENRGLPPRDDLAPEVRELGRDDRVDVRAKLGIAQQLYRVPRAVEQLLQVLRAHLSPVLIGVGFSAVHMLAPGSVGRNARYWHAWTGGLCSDNKGKGDVEIKAKDWDERAVASPGRPQCTPSGVGRSRSE